MDQLTIIEKVTDVLAENLGVSREQCALSAHIIEDLGADSLDTTEIVIDLEETFDIVIPTDEEARLTTVGSVVAYIQEKLA